MNELNIYYFKKSRKYYAVILYMKNKLIDKLISCDMIQLVKPNSSIKKNEVI